MNRKCCNQFSEYGPCVPGCIRNIAPSCKDKAVIPSITVDFVSGMRGLADCFVHVIANNTTYYIDDKGRTTTIWAGPVEHKDYDFSANPLKLRSQFVFDFKNNKAAYFDANGDRRFINLETDEPVVSI